MENQEQQENNSVEIPEEVIETMREHAKEKARIATHNWKQKGGWVKCTNCPFPHGMRIMSNQRLININDEGLPVFETKYTQ